MFVFLRTVLTSNLKTFLIAGNLIWLSPNAFICLSDCLSLWTMHYDVHMKLEWLLDEKFFGWCVSYLSPGSYWPNVSHCIYTLFHSFKMVVHSEVRRVLSLPPKKKTERDIQLALIALRDIPSFAEYPTPMQKHMCRLGWYQKYVRPGSFASILTSCSWTK